MGLSLSAVVMGFNAKLEEKLLALQGDLIQNPKYIPIRLLILPITHLTTPHFPLFFIVLAQKS